MLSPSELDVREPIPASGWLKDRRARQTSKLWLLARRKTCRMREARLFEARSGPSDGIVDYLRRRKQNVARCPRRDWRVSAGSNGTPGPAVVTSKLADRAGGWPTELGPAEL